MYKFEDRVCHRSKVTGLMEKFETDHAQRVQTVL